jgi:hypothetical protein
MQEIKFPPQTTYFIAYTNDRICAWGVVEPDQDMVTGQPNLYQTINKNEWLAELQNFHVVWGYQYQDEKSALTTKEMIDSYYGSGTATINYAQYNDPTFWYILGDFPEVLGEPDSFQVYPN